jgi:hypothetical protein
MSDKKYTQHFHAYCTTAEWILINREIEKARESSTGKIRQGDIICAILLKWANAQNKNK